MLNVRTPIVRIPLGWVITWWCVKGLARSVYLTIRYWYATGPAALLLWLYIKFDWYGPVGLLVTVTALLALWRLRSPSTFRRFAWWPVLGRYRRWWYLRRWLSAMTTAKLAVTFDGDTVVPILKRVRCTGAADTLTVRMVTGQIPDDYGRVGERLATTFGALGIRVEPGNRPDLVVLVLRRTDPLAAVVEPLPVPAMPDFTALPIARQEDGGLYLLRLFGTQILIVGATGAGKGSVSWAVVRSLAR